MSYSWYEYTCKPPSALFIASHQVACTNNKVNPEENKYYAVKENNNIENTKSCSNYFPGNFIISPQHTDNDENFETKLNSCNIEINNKSIVKNKVEEKVTNNSLYTNTNSDINCITANYNNNNSNITGNNNSCRNNNSTNSGDVNTTSRSYIKIECKSKSSCSSSSNNSALSISNSSNNKDKNQNSVNTSNFNNNSSNNGLKAGESAQPDYIIEGIKMEKFVNQDTPKQKESSNKEIVDVCNENDGCFWKNITNDTNLGDTIGKESKLPAYTNGHNACEIKSSRCDSDEVQELDSSVSSYLFSNSAISPNPPLSKPTLAKSSTPFLFNTNFSFECFQLSGKQSTPPEESLQGSLALSVAEQETPSEANRDKAQESFVKETQFASPLVQESVKEIQHKQLFADPKDLEDSLYLFVASPPLSCSEHSDKGNDFLAQDNDNKTNSASGHFKFNTIISIDPNLNHNNNDKNDSTDSNINNNNNTNTEIYYNNDRNNSNEINNSNDKNNINENNNDNNKNSDINNNNEPATPKLLTRDKFEKSQASEGHFTSTENPVNQNGHHIELKSTTTTCVSHTIRVSCCGTSFTREYEENPLVRVSKKVGFLPGRLCICHLTGPSLLSSPNFHFQKEQLENFI